MRPADSRGFTLIELAITCTVLVILGLYAVPNLQGWIANARVRSVAESLQNDLRTAQNEALRRSRQVVFVLTSATPALGATPSSSGSNWFWDVLPITGGDERLAYLSGNQTGSQYKVSVSAMNSSSAISALCFDSEGHLARNTSTGTGASCSVPSGTACATIDISLKGADRPLRVEIQQGGKIRLCDPAQRLSSESPTGCSA